MKKIFVSALTALAFAAMPAAASAHVVVKPAQVNVASFQTFTTGVPNEKEVDVTEVRLVIPEGMNYVQPNVKPGWTVNIKKDGDTVKEIDWSGGVIPAGQRDDFVFSGQAPGKASTLQWKAYQTYADGTTVAWDQTPNGKDEEGSTPYSETKVINDLTDKPATATTTTAKDTSSSSGNLALGIGIVALLVAVTAFIKRK